MLPRSAHADGETTIVQRLAVLDNSHLRLASVRGNPAHDCLCIGHCDCNMAGMTISGVARFPLPVWLGVFFVSMQGTAGAARAEVMEG
jgi:hypothetical protein